MWGVKGKLVGTGRRGGRQYCCWDVVYKRIIIISHLLFRSDRMMVLE